MPLISHRGAAGLATANSQDAIDAGHRFNPDYIEVDINCTSDGILIVYHGSMVRFLRGLRTKESLAELQTKDPSLLTLEQYVALGHKGNFMFDIKVTEDAALDEIVRELSRLSITHMAFTSPHEKALKVMKHHFPESPCFQSQPYHHGPVTAIEIARKNKFDGIAINKWWMTPLVYRLCKIHKKSLMCYTVDSRIAQRIIGKIFPDVYIVTNRPDIYRELFPDGTDAILPR